MFLVILCLLLYYLPLKYYVYSPFEGKRFPTVIILLNFIQKVYFA